LVLLKVNSPRQPQQEPLREVTVRVYESLGDVLALTVRLDEARQAYQEALALVPKHDHIRQAHLQYKYAQTWKTQRQFDEALQTYSRAEAVLGDETAEHTPEWWQTWIDIQVDRIEIHYWQAQVHEMTDLVEKTRPSVERDGTQVQRASFFERLSMMSMRRDRYVISEETLEYARLSLVAHLELKNETGIAWARFQMGFVYLWHGDLDMAEEQLQAVQAMSEQIGDVTLQSRNLTYQTVLSRKRGLIEETRRFSLQAQAVATALQLPEYIAMAKANLAWVAWREGNLLEVQTNGLAALEQWRPLQVVYMFQWAALWPLIGVALTQDRLREAVDHARLLLAPQQQSLPDVLNTLVEAAIRSWDAGQLEAARTYLRQATPLAQEMGYL
jgi:eukaryotic-like serine/threonine-protein kinase